jgi:glutamine synthetase
LGANEAPPAIISIFLGAELLRAFEAIESGHTGVEEEKGFLGLGTDVLPPLPMHGGDRNRTSPFAFTGNKFEFRALGSSQSLSLPNTVLNTIVAEALDDLGGKLETALEGGAALGEAVTEIVKASFGANKQIIFEGDNYADEWHREAEERGLFNLRSTPDALPWLVEDQTVKVFSDYGVLSKRELESRYDVYVEQYVLKVNIEAEVAATIARTMLLPAAVRHLEQLQAAGVEPAVAETTSLVHELWSAITALESANETHEGEEGSLENAAYMRDTVLPAMEAVREVADRLERVVADDLWPLPKYSEMLFIK